jgi:hypothetical protein
LGRKEQWWTLMYTQNHLKGIITTTIKNTRQNYQTNITITTIISSKNIQMTKIQKTSKNTRQNYQPSITIITTITMIIKQSTTWKRGRMRARIRSLITGGDNIIDTDIITGK